MRDHHDRRAGRVQLLEQAHDLGKSAIGSECGRTVLQRAVLIDRSANNSLMDGFFDREGFAGEHGFVNAAFAGDYFAVSGDAFAGTNEDKVIWLDQLDGYVLFDSLTRLARAYNKNQSGGGRTMSGGMDARAMEIPKRLFGTARVFEEGGSLTVMGTALIETNSRMDDVIFQEFKGTGNMELVLDRKLADKRIFPAMDIAQSGTRKEERLFSKEEFPQVTLLRRSLMQVSPQQAMESLVQQLAKYPDNATFLAKVNTFVR